MAIYFHFSREPRELGSFIEPGNFGRIILQKGSAHQLYRREMTYEAARRVHFPDLPSRLNCVFCFPPLEEAMACRKHINGYQDSYLHEVGCTDPATHLADMNNDVQLWSLPVFDANIIARYWRGCSKSPDPKAVILREILSREPVKSSANSCTW